MLASGQMRRLAALRVATSGPGLAGGLPAPVAAEPLGAQETARWSPAGGSTMQTQTAQAPDFVTVIGAIRREYEVLDRWLAALSAEAWQSETACDEWPVYKVVSHLGSGAEITLQTLEEQLTGGPAADQEARQRVWGHFDSLAAPQPLYDEFRDRNAKYFAYLDALPVDKREQRVKFFAGELPVAG